MFVNSAVPVIVVNPDSPASLLLAGALERVFQNSPNRNESSIVSITSAECFVESIVQLLDEEIEEAGLLFYFCFYQLSEEDIRFQFAEGQLLHGHRVGAIVSDVLDATRLILSMEDSDEYCRALAEIADNARNSSEEVGVGAVASRIVQDFPDLDPSGFEARIDFINFLSKPRRKGRTANLFRDLKIESPPRYVRSKQEYPNGWAGQNGFVM